MRYLAALDYDHLDNGVFLTSLARSLAEQQKNEQIRSVIIHTDSAYTERIMQTGVMRDEATIRSMKDLNKRLVALFADQGVSTIGINPYKKNFITQQHGALTLDHSFFDRLPDRPVLLLSTLVQDLNSNQLAAVTLPEMMIFLQKELDADELFIFSKSDNAEIFSASAEPEIVRWDAMNDSFRQKQIPDEFDGLNRDVRLTTARDFNQLPALTSTILVKQ